MTLTPTLTIQTIHSLYPPPRAADLGLHVDVLLVGFVDCTLSLLPTTLSLLPTLTILSFVLTLHILYPPPRRR